MSYEHILLFFFVEILWLFKIFVKQENNYFIDNYRKMYYSNSLTAVKKIVSVLTLILWQG